MYFYRYTDKTLLSLRKLHDFKEIKEEQAVKDENIIYLLKNLNPSKSRKTFAISHPSLVFLEEENINLLQINKKRQGTLPPWLISKINKGQVKGINMAYKNWREALFPSISPKGWKIHIAGIGDVGSTLLMGLRLLGGGIIKEIGIFDLDENKLKRFEFEINQISSISTPNLPLIKILKEDDLFNCDLFAFCVTARVPSIGEETKDVRMIQLTSNSKIINSYGRLARKTKYKGIFAVISDPVDLLCKSVYLASNRDRNGIFDFQGLDPEQIRGYGLGVMYARALYYANQKENTKHFSTEGRVFGPHGADLIVADSIKHYNENLSLDLTQKTRTANLALRKIGFKPYIAPALSSGALSLIATLKGEWNYSATFMGGVYMGAKNCLTPTGIKIEMLDLPNDLYHRLEKTYNKLKELL